MNLEKLIGVSLDMYEDGKGSPSRLRIVKIEDVVPIEDLAPAWFKKWMKAVRDDTKCVNDSLSNLMLSRRIDVFNDVFTNQFWNWNCKTFIFGKDVGKKHTRCYMFAVRPNGEWYCVNYNYFLDVKGVVRKNRMAEWKKCAEENGMVLKVEKETRRLVYYKNGEKDVVLG